MATRWRDLLNHSIWGECEHVSYSQSFKVPILENLLQTSTMWGAFLRRLYSRHAVYKVLYILKLLNYNYSNWLYPLKTKKEIF